jgi:hypothetical protein
MKPLNYCQLRDVVYASQSSQGVAFAEAAPRGDRRRSTPRNLRGTRASSRRSRGCFRYTRVAGAPC